MMTLTFVAFNPIQAQNDIIINEIIEYMSKGEQTGYEIAILDAEPKDVETTWIKLMKKYKAKVINSKKSVEVFADNANIPQISDNTIDIYAIATKASYGTRLTVFVDLGGSFISSQDHPDAYAAMENFLKEYGLSEAVRVVEAELKAQEEILKDLNKELTNLVKDKDGYTKEIEKAKALIAQREEDIANNIKSQDTKRAQIEIQQEIIETVKQKRQELDYR